MPHVTLPGNSAATLLSVVLPMLGICVWVLTLPSTRRLVHRRMFQIRGFFYGTTHSPTNARSPDPVKPAPSTKTSSTRREEDPEIKKFDRSIFDRFRSDESS